MVQWLGFRALTAEGLGSIPGQGTKIPLCVSLSVLSDSLSQTVCSLPGSSVHGILLARTPCWVAIPLCSTTKKKRKKTLANATNQGCFPLGSGVLNLSQHITSLVPSHSSHFASTTTCNSFCFLEADFPGEALPYSFPPSAYLKSVSSSFSSL